MARNLVPPTLILVADGMSNGAGAANSSQVQRLGLREFPRWTTFLSRPLPIPFVP
jgi:hypothetical protein